MNVVVVICCHMKTFNLHICGSFVVIGMSELLFWVVMCINKQWKGKFHVEV